MVREFVTVRNVVVLEVGESPMVVAESGEGEAVGQEYLPILLT